DGDPGVDALDALEDAFRERGTALRIELCPLAGGDLARRLTERGHVVTGFEDMLVREFVAGDTDLAARADAALPHGVRVEQVGGAARATWARLSVEGFFDGNGPEGFAAQMEASFDVPDSAFYLATVDGQPAACSGVTWPDGVAALYAMATLPPFRRRG